MSAASGTGRFWARYYGGLLARGGFSLAKGAALPFVRGEAARSGEHEMAFPISTYAPWRSDEAFRRVYAAVRRNTLVDVWRCHELWSLLGQLRAVPGDVLEVGVWRGGTGALLAARLLDLGRSDTAYLCDTWEGVVKTGPQDIYYRDGAHDDTSREIVAQLVERMRLPNVRLLQGTFPDETAAQIEDVGLALVHIDVDVYESAKDVLEWAWPRLAVGGAVVFDDYGFPACPGVTQLVNEQADLADRLMLHNLNGHAILIKR